MKKLSGKTALITGGSSGIGLATARLFRDEGARLVITGRNPDSLARAQEELGSDTLVISSEAGNLEEIDSLMAQVKARFNELDILFVNAGIVKPTPIEEVSESQFDEIMGVNFKGVFFAIQKALPLFSANASIIATTSVTNQKGVPLFNVYAASKAALRSLVQSLGVTLISRGIRINAISPGPIFTPMFDSLGLPDDLLQTRKREMALKSPIKRFGMPEEVAKAALFLASDDSSYMLGEQIVVDGGVSLL
ncbi:MAG: SDR family oxidoreductase [Burkholderiaceae bacterium]|nr:MAG: SDR family oxidoreductase [Burkholderiaceae bacterium]